MISPDSADHTSMIVVFLANRMGRMVEDTSNNANFLRCVLGDERRGPIPEEVREQGVHRALEADVELGDLAFAQRYDLHTREAEMLEQGR